MLSSLSDCDSGDVWCHGEDCWSQYWTVFKSTSDTLLPLSHGVWIQIKRLGRANVLRQEPGRPQRRLTHAQSDWDGSYIVYDNDNCDETAPDLSDPSPGSTQGKAVHSCLRRGYERQI